MKINSDTFKNFFNMGKNAAKKAADTAKETYYDVKYKAEPFIDEIKSKLNPPKEQILKDKMVEAQKAYLNLTLLGNNKIKKVRIAPDAELIIPQGKNEEQLKKAVEKATNEYNNFVRQQAAAQRRFEEINNFNK